MRKALLNDRSGMESDVAKAHEKERGYGAGVATLKNVTGLGRKTGRAVLEGSGSAIASGVVGTIVGGRVFGNRAAGLGRYLGNVHGYVKSTENQVHEAHRKYAALDDLVNNQGVDFDEAVRQILGE